MSLVEINELLDKLSLSNPKSMREEALNKLVRISDEEIPLLIQDTGKAYWYRAVTIINEIGSPRNHVAIPRLIWLLQDLNWPGAQMAFEILEKIDKTAIIPYIESALIEANSEEDYEWIAGIKELITSKNISKVDFMQKQVCQILSQAAW